MTTFARVKSPSRFFFFRPLVALWTLPKDAEKTMKPVPNSPSLSRKAQGLRFVRALDLMRSVSSGTATKRTSMRTNSQLSHPNSKVESIPTFFAILLITERAVKSRPGSSASRINSFRAWQKCISAGPHTSNIIGGVQSEASVEKPCRRIRVLPRTTKFNRLALSKGKSAL